MPYLKVFLASMTPIGELRAGIPLGVLVYHLPWFKVFLVAFFGNITPIVFLLLLLKKVSDILEKRIYFLKRFWWWLLKKTKERHQKKFSIFGSLALIILVAVPLPFTGAWTGALAAFVFKVRFFKALILISLGVIIAGLIVTALSLSLI